MLVWFITGASRGFGEELVRQALERGDAVVATARDPRRVEAIFPDAKDALLTIKLDVTDESQAKIAVDVALERFQRIDVLVNNAGRGLVGAIEEVSDAEARAVYDVNVFGLLSVTRAVLPVMRKQRSGRILNLSSVGGLTSRAGPGVYGSTKFALEGISEALRAEVEPLGISVTLIEPGAFRTDFLDPSSIAFASLEIDDYKETVGQFRERSRRVNHAQIGDPVKGVAAMIKMATVENPPMRIQLGADCVARIEEKLVSTAKELEQWRELSLSTAYEDGK